MGKYAVLPLENVVRLVPGLHVVLVLILRVWTGQIPMLSDAQPPIVNLLVREAWHDVLRVDVRLSIDDVVLHRAPVIQSLGANSREHGSPTARRHGLVASLARSYCLHSLPSLTLLDLVQSDLLVVRHPWVCVLDVGRVTRLGHLDVESPLVRAVGSWRLVGDVIRLVSRQLFGADSGSIELSFSIQLVGSEDVSPSTRGHFVSHETIVNVSVG